LFLFLDIGSLQGLSPPFRNFSYGMGSIAYDARFCTLCVGHLVVMSLANSSTLPSYMLTFSACCFHVAAPTV